MDFWNKRLRDEIIALRKSVDAICDEYKTQQENNRNQAPPSVVINSELQVPEATERDHRRRDDRAHRQQIWLTVGTWLAFGAAAIYAGYAARQVGQMRCANKLAEEANKQTKEIADRQFTASQQQLEYTQAAKLVYQPSFSVGGLQSNGGGGQMFGLRFTNIGHESATGILYDLTISEISTRDGTAKVILTKKGERHQFIAPVSETNSSPETSSFFWSLDIPFQLSNGAAARFNNLDSVLEIKGQITYFNGFTKGNTINPCYRGMGYVMKKSHRPNPESKGVPCEDYPENIAVFQSVKAGDR